jgi:hypothetical protein
MARTKQRLKKSTGDKASVKQLATKAGVQGQQCRQQGESKSRIDTIQEQLL